LITEEYNLRNSLIGERPFNLIMSRNGQFIGTIRGVNILIVLFLQITILLSILDITSVVDGNLRLYTIGLTVVTFVGLIVYIFPVYRNLGLAMVVLPLLMSLAVIFYFFPIPAFLSAQLILDTLGVTILLTADRLLIK